MRVRGDIVNNHARLASLGQDWPRQNRCTALGVFSPLCLSCGAHPSSLAAFPSKYLQVAPYDPSVSGSPLALALRSPGLTSSALVPTVGPTHIWARGAGAGILEWGVVLGCHPPGHFRGPCPPSALPGQAPSEPESFTSCLPFSPSPAVSGGQRSPRTM